MALNVSYTSTVSIRIPKGVAWIPILLGLLFLVVLMAKDLRLVLLGTKTQGTVLPVERQAGEKFKYTISFRLADGSEARLETSPTWGSKHQAGDTVPVIYFPSNPSKGEINTARQLILPMLTGMMAASLVLGFGLVLLAMNKREKAARSSVDG